MLMAEPDVPSMSGKTVVVTGANSGIGKATAAALAGAGARTFLTARNEASGREAVAEIRRAAGSEDVELVVFDFADLASVRRGAADLLDRCDRIDVLVNNAGLVLTKRIETKDGFEATFGINHLGPFLLTTLLLDRIIASAPAPAPARIVNVSSTAHRSARRGLDFDDLQSSAHYSGMQAYSKSKLANILFTTELARRPRGTGVTANAAHPGTVATGFARDGDTTGVFAFGVKVIKPFVLTPEKGARTSVYLASSPDVADVTGQYFVKCRPAKPSAAARDEQAAARLWSVSEELVSQTSPAA
jgi:NAD(P)-dependent dehydrogenase (short-subunit alcohol dehydrogenase family)